MEHPAPSGSQANERLARTLAYAVEQAGKPRHRIASAAGMHRETLLRITRGERAIGLDEASRVLAACGASPGATMVLALTGREDLAREWMHSEMGAFLEGFFVSLPGELDAALGGRIGDLRPRWAVGTSRLIARTLAKHIEDYADRDPSVLAGR
jgi:plasmid maintenance system antidote protein VapI